MYYYYDRRRSSVNFRGKTFLPERYVCKINKIKCRNYTVLLPEKLFLKILYGNFYNICQKNKQNSGILRDFCPKMPKFCIIVA